MSDPEMPYEYGFHYSGAMGMVSNAVEVLELFNKWPDEGGYLDQDAFLIDDILRLKRLKSFIRSQYKGDKNG